MWGATRKFKKGKKKRKQKANAMGGRKAGEEYFIEEVP